MGQGLKSARPAIKLRRILPLAALLLVTAFTYRYIAFPRVTHNGPFSMRNNLNKLLIQLLSVPVNWIMRLGNNLARCLSAKSIWWLLPVKPVKFASVASSSPSPMLVRLRVVVRIGSRK